MMLLTFTDVSSNRSICLANLVQQKEAFVTKSIVIVNIVQIRLLVVRVEEREIN